MEIVTITKNSGTRNFAAASKTRASAGFERQTVMDDGLAAKTAWSPETGG